MTPTNEIASTVTTTPTTIPTHPNPDTNILIGIPAYGGLVNWRFCFTLIRIEQLLTKFKVDHYIQGIAGAALVPMARNTFANAALFGQRQDDKPYSHLLMLDVDGSFAPEAIIQMLVANKPIVVLPFSRKEIYWDGIVRAVKAGVPTERLQEFAAAPMMSPVEPRIRLNEPTPISLGGTGAMLIETSALAGLLRKHPEWAYHPNSYEQQTRDVSLSEGIGINFFQNGVNANGMYYTEDFAFITAAREAGYESYVLPWVRTVHTGPADFIANIPAFVELEAQERAAAAAASPATEAA